ALEQLSSTAGFASTGRIRRSASKTRVNALSAIRPTRYTVRPLPSEDAHAFCFRRDRARSRGGGPDNGPRTVLGRIPAGGHRFPHRDAGQAEARNAEDESRQYRPLRNREVPGHGIPGDL